MTFAFKEKYVRKLQNCIFSMEVFVVVDWLQNLIIR